MSFRLKAATIAAFMLSALAAVTASDASKASGMAAASNDSIPVTITAPTNAPAGQIVFAAPREVVQPLTDPSIIHEGDFRSADSTVAAPTLAALVESHGEPDDVDAEKRCLAGAVYFESKGESLAGQLAVARVVINRAKSGRFASSLCGVVYQRGQFSFIRGESMPAIAEASRDWRRAVAIAEIAMADSWDSKAEGALYFHARRVSPNWGKTRLASIDNHIFYR